MNVAERRKQLIKLLYRRKHETIRNIAEEFGVSVRTIVRDVEVLSLTEPIYTKTGRYDGGVYIMEGYSPSSFYFTKEEQELLQKAVSDLEQNKSSELAPEELKALKDLISSYTKPDFTSDSIA